MVSTVKVTNIDTPDNTGNVTFDRPIAGDGSGLTSLSAANLTGAMASGVTGLGYQAEADFFTFNMATGSGTTVHSLTASFTPKVIWFNYNPNAAIVGMVNGWMTPMTGTDSFSGSSNNAGTAGAYSYQNTKPQCGASGGYQYIWISSAGSGTYTVTNTKVSSPTGTGYFSLILFG